MHFTSIRSPTSPFFLDNSLIARTHSHINTFNSFTHIHTIRTLLKSSHSFAFSRDQSPTSSLPLSSFVSVEIDDSFNIFNIFFLSFSGYGSVFKAVHKETGFTLAIKSLAVNGNAAGRSDLQKEIDVLKKCRCNNVLSYYGSIAVKNEIWVC